MRTLIAMLVIFNCLVLFVVRTIDLHYQQYSFAANVIAGCIAVSSLILIGVVKRSKSTNG